MPNIVIDLTEPSSHRADLIDLTNAASDGSEAGDYPLKRPSSQQVTPRTALRRIPVMQQQHQPQQQQLLHNSPKGSVQLPLSSNFAPRSNLVHMSPSATTKHAADKLPIDQVKTASPAQTRTPPQQLTDPLPF
ncbi:unnamed protein product [Parascedosporium putredinis]|uniref:Uncharacterized protein n=1 Tax=Parascedosporium putredinis TaxID=1442378 RepID=A0A9P1H840_9PEZI|nr:unnamed protein product [Parascedosporium putredinis]CAI8002035.1 unnamed protein product [Parascedosporium putredinis]